MSADYSIVRVISAVPEHEEFVRALGHEPGQTFYLSDVIEGFQDPALLEWTDDPADALRMRLEDARTVLGHLIARRPETFYDHRIEPPEPLADA